MAVHAGGLAAQFVNVDDDEAMSIAATHFDLDGSVTRFATEKDDTFRLDNHDGSQYVLKIANPGESVEELSFQTELLRHVAEVAPALPVPRAIADKTGQFFPLIQTKGGDWRHARVLSYMPGKPLASAGSTPNGREKIGTLLGSLRHAMATFSHPASSRTLAWDVRHFGSLRPLLEYVDNPVHRTQLDSALRRFAAVESKLDNCRTQVVHNDFNTSNIVVNPESADFVTGVIDFGDAVRTAIAIDVSTALMNQFPANRDGASEDFFNDASDLLRGYLMVADLTFEELTLIPHLAMARVATRALLTTWRAKLFPHNSAYILRNTEAGWGQLDWFVSRKPDEISQLLHSFAH
ncbi:phosphotransferase [Paraburkholderia tropica]|uniref:phosphotransferase n=1 Tax=Paraburkholderia tropica TaxID=92647 RepID=UPI0007EC9FCA|nr:phosphotransferase [Paraburkholderia tropica]OBR46288.1 serine kinase [Paraburkholderia tropica]